MMTEDFEVSHGKSIGELGSEALWFVAHTLIAIGSLIVMVMGGLLMHVSPGPIGPKLVGTLLAFFFPLIVGFIVARQQQNPVAQHVWIAGILLFAIVCVWVLDLPTGNGLCEHCGALEKLWRTFFAIDHGSGLMGGDGLLVGTWIPLSLFGYALGAKAGLES